jgi:hypothetical protein
VPLPRGGARSRYLPSCLKLSRRKRRRVSFGGYRIASVEVKGQSAPQSLTWEEATEGQDAMEEAKP